MFPAVRRALVAGLVVLPLAACGGTASSTGTSAASSAPSSPTSSAPATSGGDPSATQDTATGSGAGIEISVQGTTVTPAPSTLDVKAGDQVTLVITSDRSSEVHVHVVSIEKPITAGTPLTITFTPTQTGVYEVELHDPDLLLTKIAVR